GKITGTETLEHWNHNITQLKFSNTVPSIDKLESVNSYLEVRQKRIETRLNNRIEIKVDADVDCPEPNYEKIITEYKMFHYDKSFIYDYRGILSELDIAMKLGMNRRVMLSLFKLDYQKIEINMQPDFPFDMVHAQFLLLELINCMPVLGVGFCLQYDPNSLLYISKAMDLFDMSASTLDIFSDGDDNSNISQQSALKQYLASSSSSASKQQCISSLSTSKGNFEIEDLVQGLSNVKVHHH
ncbi:1963_t:CDS:2, partial [Entrophospora sp. SA101]